MAERILTARVTNVPSILAGKNPRKRERLLKMTQVNVKMMDTEIRRIQIQRITKFQQIHFVS